MNDYTEAELELSMQTYRKLMRVTRQVRKDTKAELLERGLTGSQYAVLQAIPQEGVPLSALARHVWKDPSNITGIVDRLERSGWIVRTPAPKDRRVILVKLTAEGQALMDEIGRVQPLHVHQRLDGLTDREKMQLNALLDKLKRPESGGEESDEEQYDPKDR
ncbi:MarR family winged helix-turn-helix transcriptional regulator [Paenibacillus tarimensis]